VPALLVTVVGVVALSRAIVLPDSTRAELLGGLGYVANWVQIASGRSYAELFQAPSAVTHLWSLAIEEQFYVVFPLLVWWLVRRRPGALRQAFVLGGLLVVGAGVLWVRAVDDPVFAYYATPARAPEIAVGVVLAGLWPMGAVAAWWREGPGAARRRWANRLAVAGAAALAVSAAAWRTTDLSDGWVAGGGLAGFAVVSGLLVLAASAPGPLGRAVGWRPLAGLGRISYGLYLYHWPVVVVLSAPRVDWAPVPLFVARTAIALALAVVSAVVVEQPVRHLRVGRDLTAPHVVLAALAALLAAAILVVAVVPGPTAAPPPRSAPAVVRPGERPTTGPTTPPDTTGAADEPTAPIDEPPAAPPVVVLFGDSVPAWLVRDGGWALDPAAVTLVDGTAEGCDGAEGAPVGRAGTGVVVTVPETCTGWRTQYPPVVEGFPVDVAVLAVGTGAVLDRQLDGEFVGPCTDRAAAWYRADVVARLRYLATVADRVVLVLPAWAESWSGWVNPPDHRERTDCVRATLLAAVAEVAPEVPVDVVDLGAHLCPDGPDACRPVRETDGVHVDAAAAGPVLQWLVGQATG
jgi:peptidoglycan/LPS O-acetylase OafA/YrhL